MHLPFHWAIVFGHLRSTQIFLRFSMLLGSILDPNLDLCWTLFRDFWHRESRSYLEVSLASIFLQFLTPWKIENHRFVL